MSELARRDGLSRQTQKLIGRVHEDEEAAAYTAAARIQNGYALGRQVVHEASRLNYLASEVAGDNQGLRGLLAAVEVDVAFSARQVVVDYMLR